jgi:maltose alpha-D-glucosyltransferase/alpha-amylase
MSESRVQDAPLQLDPGARELARALHDEATRTALAAQLPAWLRTRRWFGGQTRQLSEVRIEGWLSLAAGEDASAALCAIAATDATGTTTRHPLFLALDTDGTVSEALDRSATRQHLLRILLSGEEVRGHGLRLRGEPTGTPPAIGAASASRLIGAEQSNSSIVYDDTAILKVYRRLESGPNPEVELGRYLSGEAGLAAIPPVYASGSLLADPASGGELPADFAAALLILQAFVPNDGDGWSWALDRASAAYAAAPLPETVADWLTTEGTTLAEAAALGQVTARMHAALAQATGDLAPLEATAADLAAWASGVGQEAQETTLAIAQAGYDDPALVRAVEGAQVFAGPEVTSIGLQTRVHGDYHLGQTIRGAAGWMLLDFEGEPARPLNWRRRHQHPLVDVAGMVRSWDYAARAAIDNDPARAALANAWGAAVRARFLDAYWAEADAAPHPFLPPDTTDREAILRLFELTKALYEVRYELNNRPAMISIPGDAVMALLTGGL